ncbi:hypothetical protein [Saccharospirillum sp. MSK14-1]|uniref:beta strand repeat-containing protein n=1 Tax=Saccharospirillum sp. MSK14-1 TaxID=1897632 RepID=UPI001E33AB5D|nr:hypothetical protein [Saccharospirillum sp. MSK14-1]
MDGTSSGVSLAVEGAFPVNSAPEFSNLDGDSVAWAGVGNLVTLDVGNDASLIDLDLDLLNSGNGNYDGATLTVARQGGAWDADVFSIDDDGATFDDTGSALQVGGNSFATYTNSGGQLQITFDDSLITPTAALLNDLLGRIQYRNDTPAGDALIRLSLSDGLEVGVADVTVTADIIYVTSNTDTAVQDLSNGVSFREALAMVETDASGLLTLVLDSSLNNDTLAISGTTTLLHDLTVNLDLVPDITLNAGILNIDTGVTLTLFNGTSDTATLDITLSGAGSLVKDGAGTLIMTATNTLTGLTHIVDGVLNLTGSLLGDLTVDGDFISASLVSGLVTVNSGGTIAVGDSPGTLQLDGGLDLQAGGLLTVRINGSTAESGYDVFEVSNSLTLNGDLNLIGTHVGVNSDLGTIIDYLTGGPVSGTFNTLTEGAGIALNGITYLISYLAGDGNDVGLSVLPPSVSASHISVGGAAGATFRVGETIVVEWDNSASGDNNSNIDTVTVDFSEFGGGSAVAATELSGVWTASYLIPAGTIDATGLNVSVTATTDLGLSNTTEGTDDASLDNQAPSVSDSRLDLSGSTGSDDTFIVGDTVTVTWNNTAGGDNNGDIDSVTVDFSAFGGGTAVAATNSSGTWTATYTLTAGSLDGSNLNISLTATDDAGNSTTRADSSNADADTQAPAVTSGNIDVSGATGNGGAFIVGDTLTIRWDNTASGDNNADITAVTVDFSAFGGGAAVSATNSGNTWTATYSVTEGSTSGTNQNLTVTAVDDAGLTGDDTVSATVDAQRPTGHSVAFNNALYDSGNVAGAEFTLSGAESGADYSFSITSSGGGTPVTGSASGIGGGPIDIPVNLSGLDDGQLTLTLTLTDDSGNAADPVTATAQLDINGVDSDGDGISDGQEAVDGTDPNDADDYVDTVDPTITAPADLLDIDATGQYTEVTLRLLLGLPEGASDATLQSSLQALATDNLNDCCTIEVQFPDDNQQLESGSYTLTWQATDGKGNTDQDTQTINIYPQVSFSPDQVAVEGETATVKVILSGLSPIYPFSIDYDIDPSSTASGADYSLSPVTQTVTFTVAETETDIQVTLADEGPGDGDEFILFELDDSENLGAQNTHRLTIVETNLPPDVRLELEQSGDRTTIADRNSDITVTAVATDPNGDSIDFDWTDTDSQLIDNDGNLLNNTFVFDPAGLANGIYKVAVRVTDAQGASTYSQLHFVMVSAKPTLGAGDSDGDGTDDATEGSGDDDGDGIPNYLDNIDATNLLPAHASITYAYILECNPGLFCRLGQYSLQGSTGGARLVPNELNTMQNIVADTNFIPVDGPFDFEVHDLPITGQSIQMVIPQRTPIPANSQYRIFVNGQWQAFVENTFNLLFSAPGEPGYCPPPGDDQWRPGLTPGHRCVQLTIEDGGPNDADLESNATVNNTGAVSRANGQVNFNSSGNALGGASGVFFIVLLGLWLTRYRRMME